MVAIAVASLIVVLAAIEVLVLGMLVGRGRATYGVKAPAMSGHPDWERLNRAHQNSIEQLVLFVPLFLSYFAHAGSASAYVLGIVFLVARVLYAWGYIRQAERRSVGAFLTFAVQWWLAVGAVVGLVVKIARA
jgi:uncharacterized membrane protein YecN with MAPEG domain